MANALYLKGSWISRPDGERTVHKTGRDMAHPCVVIGLAPTPSGTMSHLWGNPHVWPPLVGVYGTRSRVQAPQPMAYAHPPRPSKPQKNNYMAAAMGLRGEREGSWHSLCLLYRTTAAGSG